MRPTFGPLLVLIATWLIPAVAVWGQLNCASCNPQFLEVNRAPSTRPAPQATRWTCSLISWTTRQIVPTGSAQRSPNSRWATSESATATVLQKCLTSWERSTCTTSSPQGWPTEMHFSLTAMGPHGPNTRTALPPLKVASSTVPTLPFNSGWLWFWNCRPLAPRGWPKVATSIWKDPTHQKRRDWDIWQVKPLLSKFIGINGLDGQFLLVQNSSVDVSHPFQVGTNAHGFATGSEGIAGNFGWSTCVGSVVYGGFGEVSVEFDACQQQTSYCASDLDAVGHYFVGNLHSYQETTRTVDVTDNTPPSFLTVPSNMSLECSTEFNEAPSTVPLEAIDDCSQWTLDSSTITIPGICPQEMRLLTTYTPRDACGHVVEHLREVDITDPHAPELTVPDDVVFGCNEELVYEDAFAVDACEGELTVVELTPLVVDGECPSNYTVIRTFVATDGCGNDTTATQSVEVRDLEPPSFTMPEDVLLDCAGPENYPEIVVSDNCTPDSNLPLDISNFLAGIGMPRVQGASTTGRLNGCVWKRGASLPFGDHPRHNASDVCVVS